uniref:Uncharacterized protein n=1 Tax=Anguilla anguilla TaxID=7936 RepID=A0A0E9TY68_ANGAN
MTRRAGSVRICRGVRVSLLSADVKSLRPWNAGRVF